MSLASAIEDVYDAFSDVEKPSIVDGCPCCMTADEYETLTAEPLRELTVDELSKYADSVLLTMGSEDDYPYFLPRILELSVGEGPDWITSIEITANKLQMAGFGLWSEKRETAVKNLWLAFIREKASSDNHPDLLGFLSSDIDSWLAAATLIPIPTSPLLAALETAPEVVREIYNVNFQTLFQGRLDNAFLKEPSDGQAEIAHWLRDRIQASMK
jgi:hypothetical protein